MYLFPRIARGRFSLNGKEYSLPINNGENHLHGGPHGFSRQVWKSKLVQDKDCAGVEFQYKSIDGEENYPGNVTVSRHNFMQRCFAIRMIHDPLIRWS